VKAPAIRDRILELRRVPALDLIPNPRNWRRHPKAQREALRGVLSEIGYAGALLARETPAGLMLIDGHLRAETTPEMEVPVLVLDVTEAEADKILLTLDPLAAMADADEEALKSLLADVSTEDAAVRKMLSDLSDDAGIKKPVGNAPEARVDEAEELRVKWGVERGQLWTIGKHRLLCGDSTSAEDVGRLMGGERADCVFTSPPYGVGIDYGTYEDTITNLREMLPQLAETWRGVVVPCGFAVVNFGDIASGRDVAGSAEPCEYPMALEYFPVFRAAEWVLWSRRVWCKPNPRVHSLQCIGSNRAATDWEHVWTWKTAGDAIVKRVDGISALGWIDTSHDDGVAIGKETHGAGMALGLPVKMLAVHSRDGAVVHEPFCGTGTTFCAAEQLSRRCFGLDIEPKYVAVALQRLADMGLSPVLEA